jgi:putative restriction endonuclease
MLDSLGKYFRAFKKLHVDRSHGVAPHKPILLLSVLQLFQNNDLVENKIRITPELIAFFRSNWSALVKTRHDCRISYPFYYLKSDKFWKLVPRPGYQAIDQIGTLVKSLNSLNSAVEYAYLDEELYLHMLNMECNQILQNLLLEIYFPETKVNYEWDKNKYQLFEELKNKILYEQGNEYKEEILSLLEQKDEDEIFLRGSIFKREIPRIYNFTCCISELRIDSETSVSMIDACHIIPFSKSFDDTVSNGIALCPNLHRAFDRGLITLDDDYRVRVSRVFSENDSGYGIRRFEGKKIILPDNQRFSPLQESLVWHRKNIFKN